LLASALHRRRTIGGVNRPIVAQSADTSPEADDAQVAAMRSLSGARRMELALEMSEEIAAVAKAGASSRSTPTTPTVDA
jgi:hypothetical protein